MGGREFDCMYGYLAAIMTFMISFARQDICSPATDGSLGT